MFTFIDGLPQDVLAVEATGKVSHEDYKSTLIPKAEAMMGKGPIKMLYVIGKEFTGFEVGALWDDSAFGLRHWHDFSHIAVVTDYAWLRVMVGMLKPFFTAKSACSQTRNCRPRNAGSRTRELADE